MRLLQRGFTIVEMSVVLGIAAVLISYATVNLTSIQHITYLAATINTVTVDLKQQQLKAMVGDTEGRASHDHYGIYFEQTKYTLFHGSTYSSSDTANAIVPFDNNVQMSATTFPQSQIIFNGVSGEVIGFTNGQNTITLRNSVTAEQKTITINRYGVITNIN